MTGRRRWLCMQGKPMWPAAVAELSVAVCSNSTSMITNGAMQHKVKSVFTRYGTLCWSAKMARVSSYTQATRAQKSNVAKRSPNRTTNFPPVAKVGQVDQAPSRGSRTSGVKRLCDLIIGRSTFTAIRQLLGLHHLLPDASSSSCSRSRGSKWTR